MEQIISIKERFSDLLNLFEDPFCRKLLDVENNIVLNETYQILDRIYKNVQRYNDKRLDFFYIGFMGNFSSGKSSTINSLLNPTENYEGQEVGRHPTHKGITLIIHPSNEQSFLRISSYGQIPIDTVFFSHDLLNNSVIMDTPGAGDTDKHLMKELMEDYLTQCDFLLYFINPTAPLTQTDIPVLIAKERYLPDIEMKFIITRADDFRINYREQLTEDNFNEKAGAEFVKTAINRFIQLLQDNGLKLGSTKPDDFLFIDNKSKFRITELSSYIKNHTDPNNFNSRIKNHEHKIRFYKRRGNSINTIFLDHVNTKLLTIQSFIKEASQNITNYEDKVRIANSKLSEKWKLFKEDIKEINSALTEPPKNNYAARFITDNMWSNSSIIEILKKYSDPKTIVPIESKKFMDMCVNQIQNDIKTQISEYRAEIDNIQLEENFKMKFDLSKIIPGEKQDLPISLQKSLSNNTNIITHAISDFLNNTVTSILKEVAEFISKLNTKPPLDRLNRIIDEAKSSINYDLEIHFYNVELFHLGVFSKNVKEYTANLGISEKLATLENSIGEFEKDLFRSEVTKVLFPELEKNITELKTKSDKIIKELKAIESKLRNIDFSTENNKTTSNDPVQKQKFAVSVYDNLISRTRSAFFDASNNIEILIFDTVLKNKANHREINKKRALTFMVYLTIAVIAISTMLFLGNKKTPDSITGTVNFSIFLEVALSALVISAGFIHDKIKKKILVKDKRQMLFMARQKAQEIFKKSLDSVFVDTTGVEQVELHYYTMIDSYMQIMKSDSEYLTIIYLDLYNVFKSLNQLDREYKNAIDQICSKCSEYFEFDETKLSNISSMIKRQSIQPPFNFLRELEVEISGVKEKFEAISF